MNGRTETSRPKSRKTRASTARRSSLVSSRTSRPAFQPAGPVRVDPDFQPEIVVELEVESGPDFEAEGAASSRLKSGWFRRASAGRHAGPEAARPCPRACRRNIGRTRPRKVARPAARIRRKPRTSSGRARTGPRIPNRPGWGSGKRRRQKKRRDGSRRKTRRKVPSTISL